MKLLKLLIIAATLLTVTSCSDIFGDGDDDVIIVEKTMTITLPTKTSTTLANTDQFITGAYNPAPTKVSCYRNGTLLNSSDVHPYLLTFQSPSVACIDTIIVEAMWGDNDIRYDTLFFIVEQDTLNLVGGETIEAQARPWIIKTAQVNGSVHIKSGAVVHFPSSAMRLKNGTLTIDSGAVLKFGSQTYIEIYDNGNIIANGTATAPITFTNLDVNTYWGYPYDKTSGGGIYIEDNAATNNSITGVVINMANIGIQAQRENGLTLSASTIKDSKYYGMVIENKSLTSLSTTTFTNSGTNDIYVESGVIPAIASGNTLSKAIEVENAATDMSGTIPAYTYLFNGSYVIKGDGTGTPTPVTIAAGAVCTFKEGAHLEVNSGGQVLVAGTTTAPVTFSNAEVGKYWGAPYTETSGGGIYIEEDAATGNTISNAIFTNANVGVQSQRESGVTISGTRFITSEYYGIVAESNTISNVENCFFSGSGTNDIYAESGVITKIGTGNTFEKAIQVENAAKETSGTIQPYSYQIDGSFYVHGISTTPTPVTILPGATLKFKEGAYLEVDNGGQLIAKGSANVGITFTNAEPGKFWGYPYTGTSGGGIFIENDAAVGNEFDYITINRANVGINNDVIHSFTVTNSTISDYEYYGIVTGSTTNDITTGNTISSTIVTAVTDVLFED